MRLISATISGFRCFGLEPTKVGISPRVTAVVGPNAAGKTAVLQALSKLFGVSRSERTVATSDFHVEPETDDEEEKRSLYIDVLISLPELVDGTATPETIAPSFRHMLLERKGKAPVCRIRLEAMWEYDGTVEGSVTQNLYWIDTLDDEPADDKKHPVAAADRGLIQLFYTPATRDPAKQIKSSAGALTSRLLRAIEWSAKTEETVTKASEDLAEAFEGEDAIDAISEALEKRWSDLHDDETDKKPRLSLVSRRFEEIISKIAVIFEQGPDGNERGLDALSDGQQSLFYFALAAAVFDLERDVVAGDVDGFYKDQLRIPALTIFALEEPENHLSPYFLARIVRQVRSLTEQGSAQAVFTSHSPALLSRVQPREVRYCRRDADSGTSSVKKVKLPAGTGEDAKFVRGALLAYPELYFARFVLLVEGDSERIVLPKLAEAKGLLIDPAFVAIVPLGGRHVTHFWKLLTELGIPHATLLDLDLGRHGGGYGRVKTALEQLIANGAPREQLLKLNDDTVMTPENFAQMHTWDNSKNLKGWVEYLETKNVYFSVPLDLDLAMLKAFPGAYEATIPVNGGPKMTVEKASEIVLGTAGPGLKMYEGARKDYPALFPAYRYHFMTNSKPATHLAALTHIGEDDLKSDMPPVLSKLVEHIAKSLRRD
jgi:putative ATP-dependent endonuclease of OLD family